MYTDEGLLFSRVGVSPRSRWALAGSRWERSVPSLDLTLYSRLTHYCILVGKGVCIYSTHYHPHTQHTHTHVYLVRRFPLPWGWYNVGQVCVCSCRGRKQNDKACFVQYCFALSISSFKTRINNTYRI